MLKRNIDLVEVVAAPSKRSRIAKTLNTEDPDLLCHKCARHDLRKLLERPSSSSRRGTWNRKIGVPDKSAPCGLCRLFAHMLPDHTPPEELQIHDVGYTSGSDYTLRNYQRWQEDGQPHFLKVFSANAMFGIKGGSSTGCKVDGGVLMVEPGWTKDYYEKVQHPWKRTTREVGFMLLEDNSANPKPYTGRRIEASRIDWKLITSWLDLCKLRHLGTCGSTRSAGPQDFEMKVIDCQTRKIVAWQETMPYIALSYVWGRQSIDDHPPGAEQIDEACPAVIDDAIKVVQLIQFRYLWVDRYCINQSDSEEKHAQIANMDLVYENAYLTIIAAAGFDATYGLPGVGNTMRRKQHHAKVKEITVVASPPDVRSQIRRSSWSSRGWTYQEGILSRRRLIFTEYQVYFECSAMHCIESVNLPLAELHVGPRFREDISRHRLFPLISIARNLLDFVSCINEYATRSLSYDSDALNAFLGVLKVFEKSKLRIRNYQGLPLFDTHGPCPPWPRRARLEPELSWPLALSWTTESSGTRRIGHPSWTWIGWKSWRGLAFNFADFISHVRVETGFVSARLEVHAETRENVVICLHKSDLDPGMHLHESPVLRIRAFVTKLDFVLSDTNSLGQKTKTWKIVGHSITLPLGTIVHFDTNIETDVFSTDAILLGYNTSEEPSLSESVKLKRKNTRLILLMIRPVTETEHERIGVCAFDVFGDFDGREDDIAVADSVMFYYLPIRLA